jgi:hypothetical protein
MQGLGGQLLRYPSESCHFIGQFRWTRIRDQGQAEHGAFHLRDHLQHCAGGEIFFRELVFKGAEYHQILSELPRHIQRSLCPLNKAQSLHATQILIAMFTLRNMEQYING